MVFGVTVLGMPTVRSVMIVIAAPATLHQ